MKFKDLPIEIQERMLDEFERQTGKARDKHGFDKNIYAGDCDGGFCWHDSPEDKDFWSQIITHGNFDVFYQRYPKLPELPELKGVEMMVSDDGISWRKRLVFGRYEDKYYSYSTNGIFIRWRHCKPIEPEKPTKVVLTMQQVADLAGVDVNNLQIKK